MKEILLTRGYVAIVDDEDYPSLAQYTWCALSARRNIYAARRSPNARNGPQMILMHRAITGALRGQEVDHINRNTLDNRRSNLRACERAQNACNRGANINNTSGYKGVSWRQDKGKYRATISVARKQRFLGHYNTPEEAASAYDRAAIELHGDFAKTNFKKS